MTWPAELTLPPNPALPWNSRRFRRTTRCSWCGRPATRAFKRPYQRAGWFTVACEDCWRLKRRHALPATEQLTRAKRRLRWAIRCLCGKPGQYVSTDTGLLLWGSDTGLLSARCRECRESDRQFTRWYNVFCARKTLVRRNVPHGDLRQQLLRWVRETE